VALDKAALTFIAPEGASTTSSTTLHRYDFQRGRWYRFTYTPAFRSILAEPDGTLISGDTAGFLRTMDTGTDDDGTAIPIVVWTPVYDNGSPLAKKEPLDLQAWLQTAGGTLTVAYHVDGSSSLLSSYSIGATTNLVLHKQLIQAPTAPVGYRLWQFRLSGSFTTFKWNGLQLNYFERPMTRVYVDTGWFSAEDKDLAWLRELRIFANATENMTLYLYLDGNTTPSINGDTITVTAGRAKVYSVPVGREKVGTSFRVALASATTGGTTDIGFELYWIRARLDRTGEESEKERVRWTPLALEVEA
jgi:hypothetical protein